MEFGVFDLDPTQTKIYPNNNFINWFIIGPCNLGVSTVSLLKVTIFWFYYDQMILPRNALMEGRPMSRFHFLKSVCLNV